MALGFWLQTVTYTLDPSNQILNIGLSQGDTNIPEVKAGGKKKWPT